MANLKDISASTSIIKKQPSQNTNLLSVQIYHLTYTISSLLSRYSDYSTVKLFFYVLLLMEITQWAESNKLSENTKPAVL